MFSFTKSAVISALICFSFAISTQAMTGSRTGSLLYTLLKGANGSYASGTVVVMNCETGEKDTILNGDIYAPTFSPDGLRIAYCLDENLYISDVYGGRTKTVCNDLGRRTISWPQEEYIFWPDGNDRGAFLLRLHIPTGKVDTVHKLTTIDDCYTCAGTGKTYNYMDQGGVSADGKHVAFTAYGCDNKVISFEIGGKEVINTTSGCQNSCQSSISPDGRLVASSRDTHGWAFIKYFNNNDSIYREIWAPSGMSFWMFRFARNSSDYVLFSSGGEMGDIEKRIHLWRLSENRYYPLVEGSGWDFFSGAWVQDTIPANAPVNLRAAETVTAHMIALSWDAPIAASDGDLPQEYVIYRDGQKITATNRTNFTDNDLTESTAYNYQVYSKDGGMRLSNPAKGTFSTVVDHEAPVLSSAECVGDCTQVILRFNEPVDNISAQITGNYLLNPAVSISGSNYTGTNRVTLTVSPLSIVQPYKLTVSGVKDVSVSVNSMASQVKDLFLITNTSSTTGNKYAWDVLEQDKIFYTDNNIAIGSIPEKLAGAYYLKTAFADNAATGSAVVSFDCNAELRVCVFRGRFDDAEALPSWMNDFKATNDTIFGRWWYAGYEKIFPAGRITLGGSSCTDDWLGNYIVVVQPTDSTLTNINAVSLNEPQVESCETTVFPNPFNPQVRIGYTVPGRTGTFAVSLRVYDIRQKLVLELVNKRQRPGSYSVRWDGRDAAGLSVGAGVYFYRLTAGVRALTTGRMILVK